MNKGVGLPQPLDRKVSPYWLHTTGGRSATRDVVEGSNRFGRALQLGHVLVAIDRGRQSLAVARDMRVVDVTRPRIDDLDRLIRLRGIAGAQGDRLASREVLLERIVEGQRAVAARRGRRDDREGDELSEVSLSIHHFLVT